MEMGYPRPTRKLHPTGHSDWSGLGELVILTGPISVLFQNLIWIGRDVEGRKRNEKQRARQIDRDSHLVKWRKPLRGPMRGERSGVCVFDGEDSTHSKARDPEGCSGPRVLINTNKCENFKGLYPLVEHGEKKCPPGHGSFLQGPFRWLQPVWGWGHYRGSTAERWKEKGILFMTSYEPLNPASLPLSNNMWQ